MGQSQNKNQPHYQISQPPKNEQFSLQTQQLLKQTPKDHSYRFQYIDNQPESLTLTTEVKQIIKAIYRVPVYFWVDAEAHSSNPEAITIQHCLVSMLICFQTVQAAKQALANQGYQRVYIISSLKLAKQVEDAFGKEQKVKQINCYCISIDYYYKLKKQKTLGSKFTFGTKDQDELIRYLIETRSKGYSRIDLMNFIPIDRGVSKSNMLVKTVYAMLNQETNKTQLLQQAVRIAKFMGFNDEKDFKNFQKDITQAEVNMGNVINWYTRQSFVYILVNTLQRVAEHPGDIYCLQPFFRELFKAIKKLHNESKKKSFTCYRGGVVGQEELGFFESSVGSIIQSLGFMSTSENQKVAEQFATNVLFIIKVNQNSGENQGFADVSQFSSFKKEAEILFNPLNFFKIVSKSTKIIKNKEIKVFELLFCPQSDDLGTLRKYQKEMQAIKTIGDVLVENNQNLSGCEEYWKKHMQISIRESDKMRNLQKRGAMHLNGGEYKKAELIYKQIQRMGFKTDLEAADHYYNLGRVYDNMGQYKKSLEYYQKCEEIQAKSLGIDHPSYAATLNNIGLVYDNMGQYKKSLEYLEKCEEIRRKSLGIDHPSYAATLNNIGSVYVRMGQYKKSLEYYQKCEEIQAKSLGIDHPQYAVTLNNIGSVYVRMGQYKKSLEYYQNCEEIRRKSLGIDHPSYAATLNNIGLVYDNMGQYKKSLEYYQKCEEITRKSLGIDHPLYATTLNNIGSVYDNMGQYKKSLEYYQKCEEMRRKSLGIDHPSYAATLNNIGSVYVRMGQYKKSLEYYQNCEEIRRKSLGIDHPSYAATLNNIGSVYVRMGQYKKSLEYYQKCEEITRKSLGIDHPQYAATLNNIGSVYFTMGQYKKSLEYLEKCEEIKRKSLGIGHPSYAATLNNIDLVYKKMGHLPTADTLFQKAKQSESKQ